jgi:hypothetical protein
MARTRRHPSVLEQSRRYWRQLAVAGALLLALGAGLLRRQGHEPEPASLPPVAVPRGRVTVEVLNGTRRQGAARTATRMLRKRGLDVVFFGNADSVAQATLVVARRGDLERARYVAAALGTGLVIDESDTLRRVDVSVILGEDFRPRLPVHP